ncbi:hypothetical protein ACFSM7_05890 [Clavibacter michiganensis subsp. tessellarius]|uniref:hypothetical protein n=1 Tax=Clavibacter tessellarius TaxID=31965 RepID=UPI00363D4CDB
MPGGEHDPRGTARRPPAAASPGVGWPDDAPPDGPERRREGQGADPDRTRGGSASRPPRPVHPGRGGASPQGPARAPSAGHGVDRVGA